MLSFLLRKKLTTFDLLLLSLLKRSGWFILCFLYFIYVSISTITVINIIICLQSFFSEFRLLFLNVLILVPWLTGDRDIVYVLGEVLWVNRSEHEMFVGEEVTRRRMPPASPSCCWGWLGCSFYPSGRSTNWFTCLMCLCAWGQYFLQNFSCARFWGWGLQLKIELICQNGHNASTGRKVLLWVNRPPANTRISENRHRGGKEAQRLL